MKNIFVFLKTPLRVSLFLIVFVLVGCNKKSTPAEGLLMVVNASPGFGPVDVRIDEKIFNTSALTYGTNTGYKSITEGAHGVSFTSPGTTTSLYDIRLTTVGNINQSFYLYDRPNSLQAFAIQDNLTTPAKGKSNIRFFQFSPNSPIMDLGTLNGAMFTPVFTNRAIETSSTAVVNGAFKTIDAGTYNFEIRVNGAGISLLVVNNILLKEAKSYTLFAKGISGNTNTPLELGIIENN